jgi:hypothetical protein
VDPGLEKSVTSIEENFSSGTKYGFSSIYFGHNFNDETDTKAVAITINDKHKIYQSQIFPNNNDVLGMVIKARTRKSDATM